MRLIGMLGRGVAVSVSVFVLHCAAAEDAVPTQYEFNPTTWGRVNRTVMPTFQPGTLAAGIESVVELEVLIGVRGEVVEIRSLVAQPAHPVIEEATRKAVMNWQFKPAWRECVPVEANVRARLEIKVEGDTPKVFLTHQAIKPSITTDSPVSARLFVKNVAEVRSLVRYPLIASRRRLEADAYGMVLVENRTGAILDAKATAIAVDGNSREAIYRQFESAAIFAMKNLIVNPIVDAAEGAKTKLCIPFSFRLGASENFPAMESYPQYIAPKNRER